jgi:hypothetical protein
MRGLLGTVADAVRSVVDPAALVQAQQPTPAAEVAAPEPTGLYEPDEMPSTEDIERAALRYDLAADSARRADRSKRAAKKILSKLPSDGIYGMWRVYRKPSARMTPDLEAIGQILRTHGIREIPMKPCADSLVVERVEATASDEQTRELVTA